MTNKGRPTNLSRLIRAFRSGGRTLRDGWLVLGIAVALLLSLEAAYRAQGWARGLLRGSQPASALHPYADSAWFPEYRDEYERATVLEWRPYVYYRRMPFTGRYINVDSAQHRLTVQPLGSHDRTTEVFFLGGSTMWGDYQRDANTIPSVVVAHLAARGIQAHGTNFGESGYVMAQGVLELILQLRNGARPDFVVTYDGINDVAAAAQRGVAGEPQNEFNRATEFRLGRAVRGWEERGGLKTDLRAFGLLTLTASERSQLLQRLRIAGREPAGAAPVSSESLSAAILSNYVGTVHIVESLAREFGFEALYVWQPNPYVGGKQLTAYERQLDGARRADPFHRRLGELHRSVAASLPNSLLPTVGPRFLDLTGVFDGHTRAVWIDEIGHTTEEGAGIVGEAIAVRVSALASARP